MPKCHEGRKKKRLSQSGLGRAVSFFIAFTPKYTHRVYSKKIQKGIKIMSQTPFTDWYNKQDDYGICHPPMDAQTALNFLAEYLDVPYDTIPESTEQVNTYIVMTLLERHSRRFRKERRKS